MTVPAAEPGGPPIHRAVTVHSDRDHVFEVFVRELGGGRVIVSEPPMRHAMTWEAGTEVELRFLELAPELTRVELEHRGLSGPGPGWGPLLDRLVAACET